MVVTPCGLGDGCIHALAYGFMSSLIDMNFDQVSDDSLPEMKLGYVFLFVV